MAALFYCSLLCSCLYRLTASLNLNLSIDSVIHFRANSFWPRMLHNTAMSYAANDTFLGLLDSVNGIKASIASLSLYSSANRQAFIHSFESL